MVIEMKISLTRNELNKFNELFETNIINKDVADCYLLFLENAKNIKLNHYQEFIKLNEIDKDFLAACKDNKISESFSKLDIAEYPDTGRHGLPQYSCIRSTGHSELWKTEHTEYENRIKDDIDHGSGNLGEHAEQSSAGRLQESLECHLHEKRHGKTAHYSKICLTV